MTVLFVFPYSQIIEATGEAYGLTQSSYALPAWRHPSEDTKRTAFYGKFQTYYAI